MEEENNLAYGGTATYGAITTNTDNNITITTAGDYLIAAGSLMYNSHTPWSTSYDMDFKVPDIFLKVIKLMIPEIKNVIVSNSSLNINSLDKIENVTVNLFIVLDESSFGYNNYEERIRDLFRMTFPNIDYVTLNVKQLDSDSNKKFDELLKFFGK
jgi:hypothetical protein